MNRESQDLLCDMLQNFMMEREELKKQIDGNLSRIQENDTFVKSLSETENEEFKLFSPRGADSVYREQINKSLQEKYICETANREYEKRLLYLDDRIGKLKEVMILEDRKAEASDPEMELRNRNLAVLNIQEEERQRIARDLHDTSLQNLAHLVHKLELSSLYIDQDPLKAKLELAVAGRNLKTIIDEIRNTIFDLRPMTFDDLGMKTALERLIDKAGENGQIEISRDIEDVSCDNNLVLVSIYRVVQECISNSVKHSGCTRLSLKCTCRDAVCEIWIEDDGKGFTLEDFQNKEKHFGLSVMQERVKLLGGSLEVDTKVNGGTRTHLLVPLK